MKEIFAELFEFLLSNKTRIILIPFIIIVMLCALLFFVSTGSSWAPFVYAIF